MSDDSLPSQTNGKHLPLLKRIVALLRRDHDAQAMRESLEEVIEESDRQSPALSAQERVMLDQSAQIRRAARR